MSQYYRVPRTKYKFNPEKPESFELSRSKIDLFVECPRCFYVDMRLGVKRVPGYPFTLNNAVDELMKREFDEYRKDGKTHPIMEEYGIDAVPFQHDDLEDWRHPFTGIRRKHEATGFTVYGAPDDIWKNPEGRLAVVDYKATSKQEKLSLSADWQGAWKRQMEVYQWLLRGQDFDVSDRGYFVYANADKSLAGLNGSLQFDLQILPYDGSDDWIDETIVAIEECLMSDEVPPADAECDYCTYREVASEVIQKAVEDEKPDQELPF
ncbi:MAG: PD-(D/E)XK nuclease family protein [Candidatus Paceibacterota bacterium]